MKRLLLFLIFISMPLGDQVDEEASAAVGAEAGVRHDVQNLGFAPPAPYAVRAVREAVLVKTPRHPERGGGRKAGRNNGGEAKGGGAQIKNHSDKGAHNTTHDREVRHSTHEEPGVVVTPDWARKPRDKGEDSEERPCFGSRGELPRSTEERLDLGVDFRRRLVAVVGAIAPLRNHRIPQDAFRRGRLVPSQGVVGRHHASGRRNLCRYG